MKFNKEELQRIHMWYLAYNTVSDDALANKIEEQLKNEKKK